MGLALADNSTHVLLGATELIWVFLLAVLINKVGTVQTVHQESSESCKPTIRMFNPMCSAPNGRQPGATKCIGSACVCGQLGRKYPGRDPWEQSCLVSEVAGLKFSTRC